MENSFFRRYKGIFYQQHVWIIYLFSTTQFSLILPPKPNPHFSHSFSTSFSLNRLQILNYVIDISFHSRVYRQVFLDFLDAVQNRCAVLVAKRFANH